MAKKHELNYTIIREALGEYLNNKNVIPVYNKKQIKEESYKLEDLENSKAYLVSKKQKPETLNVTTSINSLTSVIHKYTTQNNTPYCIGTTAKTGHNIDLSVLPDSNKDMVKNLMNLVDNILSNGDFIKHCGQHECALLEEHCGRLYNLIKSEQEVKDE